MSRRSNADRWTFARLTRPPARALFFGALGLCVLCALGGGGSRSDILSLIYVRTAAAWVFGFALVLSWRRWGDSSLWIPLLLIMVLAVWMGLQLVPLPPGVWRSLPGHDRYAALAAIIGDPQPWRPLSLVPRLTWNSLITLVPPVALMLALSIQPVRRVNLTITLWLAIGLASAVLGMLQVVGPDTSPLYLYTSSSRSYATGLFANRNHQAAFLAATLPVLAIWAGTRRARMMPAMQVGISLAAAALLVFAIFATGSRAGLLLAGLSMCVAAVLVGFHGRFNVRRSTPLLIGGGLLAVLVMLVTALILSGRGMSVTRALASDDYGGELRFVHAPLILSMARDFFPFGTGFGSFDPVFRGFEPDATLRPTYFNHAHDDYLELALTGGLPAILIAAVFVGWWAWRSLVAWRMRSSVGIAGSTIVLIMLLSSLVDYPLRTPLIAVFAATACWWLATAPADVEHRGDDPGNGALRSSGRRLSQSMRRGARAPRQTIELLE